MPENLTPDDKKKDDELARFADQVIGGGRPEVPEMDGKDQEMAELMQTVARVERAMSAERPDPAMARRIRANLLKEWEISGPTAERSSFWGRLWRGQGSWSSARQRQIAGLVMATAVVALVLFSYVLLSSGGLTGSQTTGSAGLQPVSAALIVGGLAVLSVILWWLGHPRQ